MSYAGVPNPFKTAIPIKGIAVWLKPDDLLTISPGLKPTDAEKLLKRYESAIAARMISAGIEAAAHILQSGGHDA